MPDTHTTAVGPPDELALLRRQLEREKARRIAAENIGEQATADLFETVQELRAVQTEILEKSDRARVINDLAREMRQELDSERLLTRAVKAVGEATGVDRCQVHVVHPIVRAADWAPASSSLPDPTPLTWYPIALLQLLQAAESERRGLEVHDVEADDRLDEKGAEEIVRLMGVRALVASPMWVGTHLVGWLVLESATARTWRERELAICAGLATDLGATLLQVHAYEQQRESMRRLQELDRAKDAFISNVSHELRTPLTSISGYLELISEGDLGPLSRGMGQAIDVVSRNTVRLRVLVEDLLTLSAYDSSGVRLERTTVDVTGLLHECHGALLPTLTRRRLDVELDPAPDLRSIRADRTQLERIVLNLLSNAVKFTEDGGRVRVTAGNSPSGVVLTVSDTGIGIPADEQERIFSRFFRSSLSMTAEIQGTGLGLALTKTLVEQHGGTITVDSTEGVGTTVTVLLPAGADG